MDTSMIGRTNDWIENLCVDDHRTAKVMEEDLSMGARGAYTDCFSQPLEQDWMSPVRCSRGINEEILLRPSTIMSSTLLSPPSAAFTSKSSSPSGGWNAKRGPCSLSLPNDGEPQEIFARKVFVGGLPIDVSEDEIASTFSLFGPVLVDWPRRPDSVRDTVSSGSSSGGGGSSRHMTGYVFLVFEDESSVQNLVRQCHNENGRYYLFVSSPTMRAKPVQVRPWRLSDMDYMLQPTMKMDPRRTVFIGGVPRPTKARELAHVLNELYGSVCYVGIDIDPELKYPKGAARVTFATTKSFVAAINGRFVQIPHAETKKRVEIKPYVMDDQMCDECSGRSCSSRYAPYFCGDVSCLQYYCESCWDIMHLTGPFAHKRDSHRPLIRQGDQTKLLARPSHHQNGRMNAPPVRPLRLF